MNEKINQNISLSDLCWYKLSCNNQNCQHFNEIFNIAIIDDWKTDDKKKLLHQIDEKIEKMDKIKFLEEYKSEATNEENNKTKKIINLFLSLNTLNFKINFDQNAIKFTKHARNIDFSQTINESFLSKLAMIEFGLHGWTFAGGTHKSVAKDTVKNAEEFGEKYGKTFGDKIPLATGAGGAFMEIINRGYNKTGNRAITSTTYFPKSNGTGINKEIQYCYITSSFGKMETFLIYNSISGIYFEGGFGTAFELFLMLVERQRDSIPFDAPIVFVKSDKKSHILHDVLNWMDKHNKIYEEDAQNIVAVDNADEVINVLSKHKIYQNPKIDNIEHYFVRKIFSVK